MNTGLEKLLPEDLAALFKDAALTRAPRFHEKSRRLQIYVSLPEPLKEKDYESVVTHFRLGLHTALDLVIEAENPYPGLEEFNAWVARFASLRQALQPFAGVRASRKGDGYVFVCVDEERHARLNRAIRELREALSGVGIEAEVSTELAPDDQEEQTIHVELPPEKPGKAPAFNKVPFKGDRRHAIAETTIGELQVGLDSVRFRGHIFDMENRLLKSGRTLQTLYVSDYKEAITVKRFEGRRHTLEEFGEVKIGDTVEITGSVTFDNYSHIDVVMADTVDKIKPVVRTDNAPVKRTEWHVHSSFSEMDGVSPIEEYIQTAWDWGMDAIAISDHQVVQAFPMAQHKAEALNKSDPSRKFKILYGVEVLLTDPEFHTIKNNDHRPIETEYVCFDLETTGLSRRLDKIIEIGAVKVRNREVVDRMQMFINPGRPIPARISALTHINQADVDKAPGIEEAMDKILEFFGDAVLVAHNAKFDYGFINQALIDMGREPITNPVIDTLPLAQCLIDMKRYALGYVCRYYNVAYDGEGAHRADYDAEVLSQAFLKMLTNFDYEGSLDLIENVQGNNGLNKAHPRHAMVFAKNKKGLKELFELITLSHTTYLSWSHKNESNVTGEPRLPRAELAKKAANGNLLIGSACQNGEIFDLAHTGSKEDLEKAMEFYDYIEIQPLEAYKNLIDRGSVHNAEQLRQIVRFIIEAADAKGKPVLATGDCHYVHPHEKRIRDIYINAKGGGGGHHPLYFFKAEDRRAYSAPDQGFLTTGEMLKAFEWLGERAKEFVIDNPNQLKEQIEPLYPIRDRLYPPDIEGSDQKLRDICYETAHKVYGPDLPEIVEKRLERELNAIIGAGYYVVYYISHLLVKKSNDDGYMVGSRGSVGSSFVATMSGITEVNPLEPHYLCPKCHYVEWMGNSEYKSGYDLPDKNCPHCGTPMKGDGQDIPFETFLGFEGDKVPDIDLNFSGEYQANAHAYTKEVFGDDHVFRAGTVGTVQEKTAYGYIKGYEEEMQLPVPFSEVKRNDLAKECAGVKRTTGQHPGGIVVVPLDMDVHDFTPVQYPANNPYAEWKTTHFDFHQIHDNILKFDILGHVDPTAMKMFERMTGIDVTTIPMNDPATMSIFSSVDALKINSTRYTETTGALGLPEFGTPFVRGILELTRPTTFAELVSISGLSHGTNVWLTNAKDLIDDGTCVLSEVIGCRDDIMVDLMGYGLPPKAAFTIMESVRKGKGLKPEWEELMHEHKVPPWYLDSCRKIKYMFPKAHAVAYVTNAVRIAWFKVHMPAYYYCQYFSIRCDAYDLRTMVAGEEAIRQRMEGIRQAQLDKSQKVPDKELAVYSTLELALEMVLRGFRFANLSLSRSAATEFRVDPEDEKTIIPPFTAIDGLGANVARSIVAAREKEPFLSREDVLRRTQLSKTLLDVISSMGADDGLDAENQMTLF